MNHNVIEPTNPVTAVLTLNIYDNVNNLSLATAIYNWYEEYRRINDDIDLSIVAKLLDTQLTHDTIVGLRGETKGLRRKMEEFENE